MTDITPELESLLHVDREIQRAENTQKVLQAKIDAFTIETRIGELKEQISNLKRIKEECTKEAASILFQKEGAYSEGGIAWTVSVGTQKARLKEGVKASDLPKEFVRVKEEPDLLALRKTLKNPKEAEKLAELAYLEEGTVKVTYKMEEG